jgi:hypothetical protein
MFDDDDKVNAHADVRTLDAPGIVSHIMAH